MEIDATVLPYYRLLLNCSAVEKSYWSGFASNYLAAIADKLREEKTKRNLRSNSEPEFVNV
jgi:hypothetical protein